MRELLLLPLLRLVLGALLLAVAPTTYAQLSSVRPSERLSAGQTVNAFVEWGGARALAGVRVEAPPSWEVRAAWAIGNDGARTPLLVRTDGAGSSVRAARPLAGRQRLVLRFEVGTTYGPEQVTLTPIVQEGERARASEAERAVWQTYVADPPRRRNPALQPADQEAPLTLRRDALPALDAATSFTVELWMKTVGLDEVVLSTWDGNDASAYPLELTVAPDGHLLSYSGDRTRHHAMRTPAPVADGRWHHVAFTHDAEGGWSRLFLDGDAADSLRSGAHAPPDNDRPLALGQRVVADGAAAPPYSGLIDELRVWPEARSQAQLRRTMRRQLTDAPRGVVRLGFDEAPGALPTRALEAWPAVRGDLAFSFPVEALEAAPQDGFVNLTWETKDRENEAFVVERSLDGETFTAVARLALADRIAEAADGAMRFGYTDLPPAGQVLYYRVRQVFAEGPDRISGAVKLGLGDADAALPLTLFNSPNPFPDRTLIRFEVPETQRVELSMWDVSGHQIAVLIDREVPAGAHDYELDARALPSGVYFVRLHTPQTSITHKMTLAR